MPQLEKALAQKRRPNIATNQSINKINKSLKKQKKILIRFKKKKKKVILRGFPGAAVVKNLPAKAGDAGSSPGPGRSHMPQRN